jgi:hypothetical protein
MVRTWIGCTSPCIQRPASSTLLIYYPLLHYYIKLILRGVTTITVLCYTCMDEGRLDTDTSYGTACIGNALTVEGISLLPRYS